MAQNGIRDKNVLSYEGLISPRLISERYPRTERISETVYSGRLSIENILGGKDSRKIIILGPCSIHDVDQAIEYAQRVRDLSKKVGSKFNLIMRTYFEKPRTVSGWKGLIADPYLDGSDKMQEGLITARKLLLRIAEMGVPVGTEFLDPITPSYIADLVSWAAIGARTTESQTHRQMASGLSMPVGFKNGTSGDVDIAINAIKSAAFPHAFFGVDPNGKVSQVNAAGNNYGHLILRGGEGMVNYDAKSVSSAQKRMIELGISSNVLVDCSHGNSKKDYHLQPKVFDKVVEQMAAGNREIIGVMLESNLKEGSQKFSVKSEKESLKKGVSITDACIGWDQTEEIILSAYERISQEVVV